MGVTINSANLDIVNVRQGALDMVKKSTGMNRLSRHANHNFSQGSKALPIISECRDIGSGIVNGDFQKASFNAGSLALFSVPFLTSSAGSKASITSLASGLVMSSAAISCAN